MSSHKVISAISVESLEPSGYGVGRVNGKVCFVEGALPGEVVDARVLKTKSSHLFATAHYWHSRSPQRIAPFCTHFGLCGGCRWQHISYKDELKAKHEFVSTQLLHVLGAVYGITAKDIPPPLPSSPNRFHRNRLDFSFTDSRWLITEEINQGVQHERRAAGFRMRGHFNRVIAINYCWLQASPSNEIRIFLTRWAQENNCSFFNWQRSDGMLRTLIIRNSTMGQVMVIVVLSDHSSTQRTQMLNALRNQFPAISSLYWIHNNSANDSIEAHHAHHFSGHTSITERCHSLLFHIHPKSFFQTNSYQLETLCQTMLDMLALGGTETVYDLYCGVGTLSLVLAKYCAEVWGIEIVAEAVENAIYNSKVNHITNAHFICADITKKETWAQVNHADVVVVDPPRAGLAPKVRTFLGLLKPARILYISCNPTTQARDVVMFHPGYAIASIQPIDMFPHSNHIENILLLRATATSNQSTNSK